MPGDTAFIVGKLKEAMSATLNSFLRFNKAMVSSVDSFQATLSLLINPSTSSGYNNEKAHTYTNKHNHNILNH